jgi:hypothetical protein
MRGQEKDVAAMDRPGEPARNLDPATGPSAEVADVLGRDS